MSRQRRYDQRERGGHAAVGRTMQKECPQCGENMRLSIREEVRYVPGTPQVLKLPIREWICPECDYYEEADPATDEQ